MSKKPKSADLPADDYHGQGGSYLRDPDTGGRTLVERTDNPQTNQEPADALPEPRKIQPETATEEVKE